MDKEKLIKLAEDLYQSAFDANAYYAIMMQYREMSKKYNDEMNFSPAFYQVVYGALQKACFMEIAKLYDKTKDVVSVGLLLKYCRDNLDLLTGVSRAVSYGNIDDMEGTLMLAKLGLKYQDYEMEQRHKQIVKEIYADKRSERNGKF